MTRIRRFGGLTPYALALEQMRAFTRARDAQTHDELWLVEHPPVFTLGQAGTEAHVLDAGDIPLQRSDRGGQVTYHGPGQLVVYVLVDLRRAGLGVKGLVGGIEQSVIALLEGQGVVAERREGAPGVYVQGNKIAALGLRVHRGCSYHGVSLNVAMDLAPFSRINPCGYAGLGVVDLVGLGVHMSLREAGQALAGLLTGELGLQPASYCEASPHNSPGVSAASASGEC